MRTKQVLWLVLVIIAISTYTLQAADLTVTWTGGGDGVHWSDPFNWNPDVVPENKPNQNFFVIIPAGKSVDFDGAPTDNYVEINSLTFGDNLGNEARLNFIDSGCELKVLDTAEIYGFVYASGDVIFDANCPGAAFPGNKARIAVHDGATVSIDAPSYDASGLPSGFNLNILLADGPGSLLNLRKMTDLYDPFSRSTPSTIVHTIEATNGGNINMPALINIAGPGHNERLDIKVNSGGSINMDSLSTVYHVTQTTGRILFLADGATTQTLNLPSLTSITATDFHVTNGARITAKGSPFTYSAGHFQYNRQLLLSDGPGSLLDLSAMTELNVGFSRSTDSTLIHTIEARNNGSIGLSGLLNLIGPGDNERLDIKINSGGIINMDSLSTVYHIASRGRILFLADGATTQTLNLPSLTSITATDFHVTNGARISAKDSPFTYSTGHFQYNRTLLLSDGPGSLLDLSAMTEIDARFSRSTTSQLIQTIEANNDGRIYLSSVENIIGPGNNERLNINIYGGMIDLSSLGEINGIGSAAVYFNIDNHSNLWLGNLDINRSTNIFLKDISKVNTGKLNLNANTTIALDGASILRTESIMANAGSSSITLNDPNDLFEVAGDFDLSNKITVSNPGDGTLALGGNLTYSHIDENKLPLAKSRVYFNGNVPQMLEVGGLNVETSTDLLSNDNFGFGQMVVGRCSQPSVVYLVDNIDNGNRSSDPEALYLFGKDSEDGLKISSGSTFYMCGLHVYAMKDGVMTDLSTEFDPGETCVPFDEGTLCLGCPDVDGVDNLVVNGGFENGVNPPEAADMYVTLPVGSTDITGWTVIQDSIDWTHEAYFTDPGDGERTVDLSGTATGKGAISQSIATTPGHLYHVWFDLGANPYGNRAGDAGIKDLLVTAGSSSESFSFDSTAGVGADPGEGNPWEVYWQKQTWSFVATDEMTTIIFACNDDPNTEYSVAIDNVVVHDAGVNEHVPCDMGDLTLIATYWLSECGWDNCNCEGADIDRSGFVNLFDFAALAANWLQCGGLPQEDGAISGSVKDASTLLDLEGVEVQIFNGVQLVDTTLTDIDGGFTITLLPAANYTAVFVKSGYLDATYYNVPVVSEQTTYLEAVLQVDDKPGVGDVSGDVINTYSGSGVSGMTLDLRAGINVQSGPIVASTVSGVDGLYEIFGIAPGHYTAEVSGAGFNTTFFTIVCIADVLTPDQDVTVTPILPVGQTRIILTWGEVPLDLDSHFTGPLADGSRFHMYYPLAEANNGSPWPTIVTLDLDDVTSYGPETTTLLDQISGVYRFTVHDYTNRASLSCMALADSGAQVQVYREATLVATFNVPSKQGGTAWTVFEMDGEVITPVNTMAYVEAPTNILGVATTTDQASTNDPNLLTNLPEKK